MWCSLQSDTVAPHLQPLVRSHAWYVGNMRHTLTPSAEYHKIAVQLAAGASDQVNVQRDPLSINPIQPNHLRVKSAVVFKPGTRNVRLGVGKKIAVRAR